MQADANMDQAETRQTMDQTAKKEQIEILNQATDNYLDSLDAVTDEALVITLYDFKHNSCKVVLSVKGGLFYELGEEELYNYLARTFNALLTYHHLQAPKSSQKKQGPLAPIGQFFKKLFAE